MDTIDRNGGIVINGKATQYSVKQSAVSTVVIDMTARKPVPMPRRQYDLAADQATFFCHLKAKVGI